MAGKRTLTAMVLAGLLVVAACGRLDVVGKGSVEAFDMILTAAADAVQADAAGGGWSLSAPDGGARFFWSNDLSRSSEYDAFLEFDAQPFIEAGLDAAKLLQSIEIRDGLLRVGTDFGGKAAVGGASALASYERILEVSRDSITYHMDLDHYGVDLGLGNMFEWAKDIASNNKDIVFVLNPQPFIDAGVNPDDVEGWVFAKVKTEDANGKEIEVDKFLKPFDLQ